MQPVLRPCERSLRFSLDVLGNPDASRKIPCVQVAVRLGFLGQFPEVLARATNDLPWNDTDKLIDPPGREELDVRV